MSRKHFQLFAETIAKIEDKTKRREQAETVAIVCTQANDRFNRAKFFAACNVDENES